MKLAVLNKKFIIIGIVLLSVLAFTSSAHTENQNPVIVELFTSEGCSSCPTADRYLKQLAHEAEIKNLPIITLSFHVDYWNYLGWKDPFSNKEFSNRQRIYAQKLESKSVYTPQLIINGLHGFGGYKSDLAQKYISKYITAKNPFEITVKKKSSSKENLEISYETSQLPQNCIINIALVERLVKQKVTRGENAGKILEHANVVRYFSSFDLIQREGSSQIKIPANMNTNNASVIIYIQKKTNMQIILATKTHL